MKNRGALERRTESRQLRKAETFAGTFEVVTDTPNGLEVSSGERGARPFQIVALTGKETMDQHFQIFFHHHRQCRLRTVGGRWTGTRSGKRVHLFISLLAVPPAP